VTDALLESLQRVAGPVSRETYQDLVQFTELFEHWAKHINLTSASTLSGLWHRHVLDCAQLIRLGMNDRHWVDLGSGGGFPGIVVAVLLKERAGASVDLIESNHKKAAFLRAAVTQLRLPARVHASRIEETVRALPRAEIVTARALAPLPRLLDLAEPLIGIRARALFHKGRDYRSEVKESTQHWDFDLLEHRSQIEDDSVILEISKLHRRH
jgi:16S rRNA (guanine527-N7)-methyltransferase